MKLTEILEEISVGFRNGDENSRRLNEYINMVRECLQENGALYENEKIDIGELKIDSGEIGDTFLQGSYGTHTAIKHHSYDVDADIGFILSNINARRDARERIYNRLTSSFPQYKVELRKPCITIDFNDGFKIDVAIYSKLNDEIYFHNSICGYESVTISKPKELIAFFNEKYADDNNKRSIVRLMKHFIKIASQNIEIDENNKIPSISTNLMVVDKNIKEYDDNEMTLYQNIVLILEDFIKYVEDNGTNGPSLERLCVGNTFYKVKNINEVMLVLKKVQINFKNKQYSELIGNEIFEKITRKNNTNINMSPMGTLGE
jgi:hypothetical protein